MVILLGILAGGGWWGWKSLMSSSAEPTCTEQKLTNNRLLPKQVVLNVYNGGANSLRSYLQYAAAVSAGEERAARTVLRAMGGGPSRAEAATHDLVVEGDRIAGRFEYSGTHQGTFFGVEATGRPLNFQSIDFWRVEDGLLAEHWDQLDMAGLFRQLGVDIHAGQDGR